LNTRWLRLSSKVATGALAHAKRHHASRIFCGHTHAAMQQSEDGADYFNCGSWIDARPTFITIGEDGVKIHEYVNRPGDALSDDLRSSEASHDIHDSEVDGDMELFGHDEYEKIRR
jgi:hypothetical protein